MFNKDEIKKLAKLSRITLTDEEEESLSKEFSQIVDYVSELKKVEVGVASDTDTHKNIMREDSIPHEKRIYTKKLLYSAPSTEKGYIKVNKVLSKKTNDS